MQNEEEIQLLNEDRKRAENISRGDLICHRKTNMNLGRRLPSTSIASAEQSLPEIWSALNTGKQ